jgi:hypothetical protein
MITPLEKSPFLGCTPLSTNEETPCQHKEDAGPALGCCIKGEETFPSSRIQAGDGALLQARTKQACPLLHCLFQLSAGHDFKAGNATKFRLPDLKPYPKYESYAFMGCLPWSKNVREE